MTYFKERSLRHLTLPEKLPCSCVEFEFKGLVSGIYPRRRNISLFYVYLQFTDKSSLEGCTILSVLYFNTQKREFFLLLNIPRPPYSMLGYNRTITPTNINVLLNNGPGAGGGRKKKRGKNSNLPNTFDDDCSIRLFYGLLLQGFCSRF